MAQYDFDVIDDDTTDGDELSDLLEAWRDALNSGHSGSSEPSYKTAGLRWIDTSGAIWELKRYDGADWITEYQIDPTLNRALIEWTRLVASTKTVDYTVVAADRGTLLIANKATAIAFTTSAAGLGAGFFFWAENIGVGDLTIAGTTMLTGQSALFYSDGSAWKVLAYVSQNPDIYDFGVAFANGGVALQAGQYVDAYVDFNLRLLNNTMLADQSGSLQLDVRVVAYASHPPGSGNSICASAKPTITAATKSQDTTLTGWTKDIVAGSIIRIYVVSCTTITQASFIMKYRKN